MDQSVETKNLTDIVKLQDENFTFNRIDSFKYYDESYKKMLGFINQDVFKNDIFKDDVLKEIIKTHIDENKNEVLTIKFKDGSEKNSYDISYEQFMKLLFKHGVSGTEYSSYLWKHNMSYIADFKFEKLIDSFLILENGYRQRRIIFKIIYDSDINRNGKVIDFINQDIINKDNFLQELISIPVDVSKSEVITMKFKEYLDYEKIMPDISYDQFTKLLFKRGTSDIEYGKYLKENNMSYISDINSETIPELYLVIDNGDRQRKIIFKAVYDSDNDEFKN